MNSARVGAWVLLPVMLLSSCTTASTGRTAAPPAPSQTRIEVQADPVAPASPPRPPVMPAPPAPPLSVGPVQPPPPPPAPPAAPPPPAPPAPASTSAPTIVFNFDNADVEVVIQAAAEIVGFNYVLAPAARGRKVTVQTIGRIAKEDVFNVLLTILDVNGLTAVKSGTVYRIIPREGAPQTAIRTIVGNEVDPSRAGDEIVTQIVTLRYIGAQDAVNLLRPFVAGQGAVTLHRETNLVIITDTTANIRRLLDILKLADVKVALDELQIIPIKNADAQELSILLNQMFSTGRLRTAAAALGLNVPPVPPPPAPGALAPPRSDLAPNPADQAPLIVAERRSNSLVVHARKPEMDTILLLVSKLDVDLYGGQRVFIYFVENSKAKDLAQTLDSIYGRSASSGTRPASLPGAATPPGAAPAGLAGAGAPRVPGGAAGEVGQPLTDLRFIADEVTNAIIVTTYPRLWKDIEETVKKLDRLARQVLIEVLAAEVTLTDDMKLGIEWAVRNGKFVFTNTQRTNANTGTGPTPTPPGPLFGGGLVPPGFNMFALAANEFIATLNALATENRVNVLSSPSIMTSENKKAVINVSTSVPIVTSQQVPVSAGGNTGNSITQAVEYKDAGIILTVTPRIGEQGTVALDVKQEINDVGDNEPPPINSPRFRKREAETSVVLLNNQTLVLGGLIQTTRTFQKTGIPFLNRIPVLGYLFGSTEEKIEKTELLIMITPRVVGTAVDAARLTDRMRNTTPELEQSFKLAPRPLPPTIAPPIPPPPPSR